MEGAFFFSKKKIYYYPSLLLILVLVAQSSSYWQQQVDYKMVVMDVKNYQYKGTQELVYTNNSPDT
jgi:hypothetical protein